MGSSGRQRTGLAFSTPWVVSFAAFGLFPVVFSLALSFSRFSPTRPDLSRWVGFDNYGALLSDATFWQAVGNTVFFAVGTIPFTTGIALALALLLQPGLRRAASSGRHSSFRR